MLSTLVLYGLDPWFRGSQGAAGPRSRLGRSVGPLGNPNPPSPAASVGALPKIGNVLRGSPPAQTALLRGGGGRALWQHKERGSRRLDTRPRRLPIEDGCDVVNVPACHLGGVLAEAKGAVVEDDPFEDLARVVSNVRLQQRRRVCKEEPTRPSIVCAFTWLLNNKCSKHREHV
jgi:hypothetical protein